MIFLTKERFCLKSENAKDAISEKIIIVSKCKCENFNEELPSLSKSK